MQTHKDYRNPFEDSMELRMVDRDPIEFPSGREKRIARRAKQRKRNKSK